ncbi:synaptotagmin-like protein 1 isoform X2 [Oncorhynchus tshawytscha]|uniref:synaptotagmin-like protein 1 isoform X2 n=1 Tax=Oncorhynchus tshawytscha TaxID=74940 RepID=UPI000D09E33C|nr:synaptotagmin-like protein 1 isoform X2 [Oncorhynchus tshawytscha]
MTVYNLNLDLGFLSNEEAHAVVEVLERDKRLKEIEKERIGRLLEQRGDRKSVLGWPENLRNQQTNKSSVHPSQAPHSTNIGQ